MAENIKRIQGYYEGFLSRSLKVSREAFKRALAGSYGYDDMWKDCAQIAARGFDASRAACKEIFDPSGELHRARVPQGASGLVTAIRVDLAEGTELACTALKNTGEGDPDELELEVTLNDAGDVAILGVPSLQNAKAGQSFEAGIFIPRENRRTIAHFQLDVIRPA
jgi:hypothetical protein